MILTYTPKKYPCGNPGCKNHLIKIRSTDKYCSASCAFKMKKNKGPAKQIKRQPIAKVSKKRAAQIREYNKRVKVWKVGKKCAVYPYLWCVDCHHIRGREGEMLLDERYWLPVSREGHNRIERNPDWAREQGFIQTRVKE